VTKIIIEETLENKGFSLIPTILKDMCGFWDEMDRFATAHFQSNVVGNRCPPVG